MQEHEHVVTAADRFLPHGFCYLWEPRLLWSHVGFDTLIGVSYLAISGMLVWLVWRGRNEFPFQGAFLAFGTFIVACGATHLVAVWNLWNPDYWFAAGVKGVTALASVGTALILPPLLPRVLRTVRQARASEEMRLAAARAEAQRESDARFRQTFEHAGVGVAHVGLDGRFLWVNQQLAAITGYSREALTERTFQDITHPADLDADLVEVDRLAAGEIPSYRMEKRYLRADGTTVWVSLTGSAVRGVDGTPAYYVAVVEDIDARKALEAERVRTEAELRAAKEAAEEASRVKSDFMATMSHELRTPLGAVIGYAELLQEGVPEPVGPKARAQAERIGFSARHLRQLIDDILSFSRMEAGHMDVEQEDVSVAELVREVEAVVEPLAMEKGIGFAVEAAGAPDTLRTDPRKLRQILLNLLGNAVKFTEEGRVVLALRREDGALLFDVRDTGIGIATEDLDRLFDPFWQADSTRTRKAGGAGLGLSISRHLAELLGGSIAVESEQGEGSTFTLRLPTR